MVFLPSVCWVYGQPNVWDSWIVGGSIAILAIIRLSGPPMLSWLGWINCALGLRTFASPWIFNYTGETRRLSTAWLWG